MPSVPFARLCSELRALYAPPVRAAGTWGKMRQVLDEFAALSVARTSGLTPTAIAAWLAAHPRRAAMTSYSLLRSLRAACRYAERMGYLKADPFAWRGPAGWVDLDAAAEAPRDRHLTGPEVAGLLRRLDAEAKSREGGWPAARLRALVYTYAYTGMRKREALGLLAADVDLANGVIRLRSNPRRKLKTRGSAAPLAIARPLAKVLAGWLPAAGSVWAFPGVTRCGPWLAGGPGIRALDQVKSAGERAGIEGLTILSFRHTIGTLSEGWGFGELELQRWLRHRRRRTQDAYRKADLDGLRRSAAKIRFDGPQEGPGARRRAPGASGRPEGRPAAPTAQRGV